MAGNEYNPAGAGGLKELNIKSGDQTINLIPLLERIQINENLMSPSFKCVLYLIDALDLINSLPIVGEEIVTCVLNTPPLGDRKYKFIVTAVDNVVSTAASTTSRYIRIHIGIASMRFRTIYRFITIHLQIRIMLLLK